MLSDIIEIVSALAVVVTIVLTYLNNVKQNKLAVITAERVKKYNLIAQNTQIFLGDVRCCLIQRNEKHLEVAIKSSYALKILFHYGFKHDKTIIDICDEVVELLLADKNNNQIEAALIVLHSLIDIYLSTEWVRIKTETTKDNRNKQYTNWCKEYDICSKYNANNHKEQPMKHTDVKFP